ncbi:MAG TPA: 1,4-dihydroxy-2-naphthoate polyprenyltransferase, partial [Myxococcales bacterium]
MSELAVPRPGFGVWLMAARPRTLSAAVSPVLVGTAIAHRAGALQPLPALLALLASLFIQIGTNFANDYSDFKHGADANRLGPRRVTQSGLVAPGTVKLAAWIAFGISGVLGIGLAALSGWPVIAIGVASVAAGWLYTGGPWPLGYHGLGDLFVFVFFGLVATCGTAYAQALFVPREAWVAGAAVGSLATAILVVNNLRDRQADAK